MTFDPTPSRQRKAHDMRRALLVLIALAAFIVFTSVASDGVSATGDVHCPDGTEFSYKIDDLTGPTFTIPTPPPGWEVVAVIVKAGRRHYLYQPVTPGQILDVNADTGHDISHAHICKRREPSPSTTAPPTTTTTTSTQSPSTTSSTTPTTTPGSSTSSIPASTSTAPVTTSMSTPPTSTSTSSVPVLELPPTGSQKTQITIILASLILALGLWMIWLGVRRPRRE